MKWQGGGSIILKEQSSFQGFCPDGEIYFRYNDRWPLWSAMQVFYCLFFEGLSRELLSVILQG